MTDINSINCKIRSGRTFKPTYQSWYSINWGLVDKKVTKLRSQIYLAKLQGNLPRLRKLQRAAISSKLNLLLAIRKVTSINWGKKTAGLDKQTYLTPEKRLRLYQELSQSNLIEWKPSPVRRIEIPRPGKYPRPLDIPTIKDRIVQMVIKTALEPEWEQIFEHGSYGFRPNRSAHDAMARIWRVLSSKKRMWVLDADIKGCFNNIAHAPLLKNIEGFPAQSLVERWLKAGYFAGKVFHETDIGTPQGGIISPLLANIALHGMEKVLGVKYHTHGYVRTECPYIPARYADNLVVLCRTEAEAKTAQDILTKWLAERGMEFAPEKTKISNVQEECFDFLGWTFRQFPVRGVSKSWSRKKEGIVTLVRPSEKSMKAIKTKLKDIWRHYIGQPAWLVITKLNSILSGWSNYHKFVNANEAFREIDNFNYLQAVRYAKRKHTNKSWAWIKKRYFSKAVVKRKTKNGKLREQTLNWVFFEGKFRLVNLRTIELENYSSIGYGKNACNPEDRDYFLDRKLKARIKKDSLIDVLHKKQQGICPVCGINIVAADWDEPLHVHHLVARKDGGSDNMYNLMLLHEECHYKAYSQNLDGHALKNLLARHIPAKKLA
jgi:RNA-directed DNA polymerase